ncbi:MAG: protein kinase [Pelolinea sp.]|nr:protein kinase [Pelolinea sp.]
MDDLTSSFPIVNNRYQIFSTIATGGMSVIYNAQDLMLERKVALKILKKELSRDQTFQNKFRSEAKASASLIHPNIITTFDFGFDGDRLYIVMEYIDGADLKTIINQNSPLSISQALDYLLQASKGLEFAHQSGFVHCDVKPQNMLVSKSGILKITDFGIARALDTISREEKYDVVWGSPYYFSPEQASGKAPSPATDVYSLGIIAYELVTGRLPFIAEDSAELARMHRSDLPIPPKDINAEIPESLNQSILKALSKDPANRYQNGEEFHRELISIQQILYSSHLTLIPVKKPESILKTHKGQIPEIQEETSSPKTMQFSTILIAIMALLLVGGLIPFWLYIILSINSLNR